jgi:hypothetical protein
VPVLTLPEKGVGRELWPTGTEAAPLLGASIGFVWDAEKAEWKRQGGPPASNGRPGAACYFRPFLRNGGRSGCKGALARVASFSCNVGWL